MIAGFKDLSLYEILDISPGVEAKEIQEGYYRVRETFTKNALASYSLFSQEEREEILRIVEDAYLTLIDQESRDEYNGILNDERSRLNKGVKLTQEPLPFMETRIEKLEAQPEDDIETEEKDAADYPVEEPPADVEADLGESIEIRASEVPLEKSRSDKEHVLPADDEIKISAAPEEPAPPESPPPPPMQTIKTPTVPVPKTPAPQSPPPIGERMAPPEPEPVAEIEKPAPEVREIAPPKTVAPPPKKSEEEKKSFSRGDEAFEDTIPDIPPPRKTINPLDYLEGAVTGKFFERVRQAKGLSHGQVWEVTRIRKPILAAIEKEDYKKLPADVFLKGMLLIYSRLLEIEDPQSIVNGYMERLIAARDWLD